MQAVASSPASWLFAFLAIVVAYLLPTLIEMIRRVGWLALVILANLTGAPAGAGWLTAVILASGPRTVPDPPAHRLHRPDRGRLPGDQGRGTAGLTAAWPPATPAAIPEPLLAIPGGSSAGLRGRWR